MASNTQSHLNDITITQTANQSFFRLLITLVSGNWKGVGNSGYYWKMIKSKQYWIFVVNQYVELKKYYSHVFLVKTALTKNWNVIFFCFFLNVSILNCLSIVCTLYDEVSYKNPPIKLLQVERATDKQNLKSNSFFNIEINENKIS